MQDSWEGWGGMASSSKDSNGGERVGRDVKEIGRKEEEALLLNLPSKSCRWGVFPALPVLPASPAVLPPGAVATVIPARSSRSHRMGGTTGSVQSVLPPEDLREHLRKLKGCQGSSGPDPVPPSVEPTGFLHGPVLPAIPSRYYRLDFF